MASRRNANAPPAGEDDGSSLYHPSQASPQERLQPRHIPPGKQRTGIIRHDGAQARQLDQRTPARLLQVALQARHDAHL
jgi:hypothetical protein